MAGFGPTETYRGRTKSRSIDQGDEAIRVFTVVNPTDEEDAMDTVSLVFGVERGTPYGTSDEDKLLLCHHLLPRYTSANVIEVTCSFKVPPRGYFQNTVDPLTLPWKFEWKTVIEQPPFDRDIDNNPVLNSTYLPPSTPPTKNITYKELRIYSNEPFYDYVTYKQYENTVNSDSIELIEPNGNSNIFDPGTMFCVSVEPREGYSPLDTFVPMMRTFHIYDLSQFNSDLTDPFQLHLLDASSMGYDSAGNLQHLYTAAGDAVTQDQPLDGTGIPVDTTLKVKGASGSFETPSDAPSGRPEPPTGATVELSDSGSFLVVYLRYKRYKAMPFLPLLTPPSGSDPIVPPLD